LDYLYALRAKFSDPQQLIAKPQKDREQLTNLDGSCKMHPVMARKIKAARH